MKTIVDHKTRTLLLQVMQAAIEISNAPEDDQVHVTRLEFIKDSCQLILDQCAASDKIADNCPVEGLLTAEKGISSNYFLKAEEFGAIARIMNNGDGEDENIANELARRWNAFEPEVREFRKGEQRAEELLAKPNRTEQEQSELNGLLDDLQP